MPAIATTEKQSLKIGTSYDARKAAQDKRDAFAKQLNDISDVMTKLGVDTDSLASLAAQDTNAQKTSNDGLLANISLTKRKRHANKSHNISIFKSNGQRLLIY
jgi:hypothetical protein